MKEYEHKDDFTYADKSYEYARKDYSEVEGSEELRNFFVVLRTGGVVYPFRQFDWDSDRWFVSSGAGPGFWLTKSEARFISFQELFYNIALAEGRARSEAHSRNVAKLNMERSDELKELGI